MVGIRANSFSARANRISRFAYAAELLTKEGDAFIEATYLALLSRLPDPSGKKHYLQRLATGTSKTQVLTEIYISPECQTNGNYLFGLNEAIARDGVTDIDTTYLPMFNDEVAQIRCAKELLRYDGERLIEYAYLALLKRPADAEGVNYYLERLKTGPAKSQILYEIFMSQECHESGAELPGVREAFLSHNGSILEKKPFMDMRRASTIALNTAELLQRNGSAFVECAYLTLILRPPDVAGFREALLRLQSGVAKTEILADIVSSKEARAARKSLPGLSRLIFLYRLSRIPVVGILVRLVANVEGRSAIDRRIRGLEARMFGLRSVIPSAARNPLRTRSYSSG